MDITVINGSPKSEISVTQQYIRFLEQNNPQDSFSRIHVARKLKSMERDPETLADAVQKMANADLIIWSFPVYYFLVPSQLKRFIELLFEHHADELRGKYYTCITTSIHFFDHTAHDYIRGISEDLGMKHLPHLSAGMNDLLKDAFRTSYLRWFEDVSQRAMNNSIVAKSFQPVGRSDFVYEPGEIDTGRHSHAKNIALISDADDSDTNLLAMEQTLVSSLQAKVDRISIKDLGLRGGCLGCLRCGWEGKCIYRDGFQETFRERILTADAIVFSAGVRDRFLSSRFKMFFDRSFFLGHRPELEGKPLLWLVAGPLMQLHTLREVIQAHAGVSKAILVDIITDEAENSETLDRLLAESAERLHRAIDHPIRTPRMFPAVAGSRTFRDFVYLTTAIFRADHLFYRKTGFYDFPQRKRAQRFSNFSLYWAMHIPSVRKKVQAQMTRLMLRPYEKIVGPLLDDKSEGTDQTQS